MLIPSFSSDTCLVLNKPAAVIQANKVNELSSLKYRFAASQVREKALKELWQNTKTTLDKTNAVLQLKEAQIMALEAETVLHTNELKRVVKAAKKQRLKALLVGGGVGFLVGGVLMGVVD